MPDVFLCGQKCAGKTHYLHLLKDVYNAETYDTDEEILKDAKYSHFKSIREVYLQIQEEAFRNTETIILNKILSGSARSKFIALGGGALHLISTCNKKGKTVYLYLDKKIIFTRMQKLGLPSFIKNYSDFSELFEKRDNFYRKHCSILLDIRNLKDQDVCDILMKIKNNSL